MPAESTVIATERLIVRPLPEGDRLRTKSHIYMKKKALQNQPESRVPLGNFSAAPASNLLQ